MTTGSLYLYVKTIERAHSPLRMWEKIKLSKSYARALAQIDTTLEHHYSPFLIHKCKQRLTKMTQSMIRMRRLALKTRPRIVGVNRTLEKRLEKREKKAEVAAKLTTSIEAELLERLKRGVYDVDGIVNESQEAFGRALDSIQDAEGEEMEMEEEEEEDYEEDLVCVYVF
jgi:protein MAK16